MFDVQHFDKIAKITERNNKINEGDYYGENDLLYCGKCHTRKQTEVIIFGEVKRPYCLCKCEYERKEKEEQERKHREIVDRLRVEGFPDRKMHDWTFANDDMQNERITKAMRNYVDNFTELKEQGKGLLLYGNCGTGKSFSACEIANALIDMGISVLVTNFAKILNELQNSFEKQYYIDRLNNFSLLVIDDLGIERNTEYAKEQVYNIIDSRYRAGKPMIITTNLTMDKMKSTDDIDSMRIYDRILEKCFPIEFTGRNKRRKAVKEGYEDMKNLLGL